VEDYHVWVRYKRLLKFHEYVSRGGIKNPAQIIEPFLGYSLAPFLHIKLVHHNWIYFLIFNSAQMYLLLLLRRSVKNTRRGRLNYQYFRQKHYFHQHTMIV
jgi:hypothetical protein